MSDLPVIPEYPEITPDKKKLQKNSRQSKSENIGGRNIQDSALSRQISFPHSSASTGNWKKEEESVEYSDESGEDEGEEEEEDEEEPKTPSKSSDNLESQHYREDNLRRSTQT